MGHKVLLQFLIGVVDAQLLQVVDLKTLEAVHIQHACRLQTTVSSGVEKLGVIPTPTEGIKLYL